MNPSVQLHSFRWESEILGTTVLVQTPVNPRVASDLLTAFVSIPALAFEDESNLTSVTVRALLSVGKPFQNTPEKADVSLPVSF
jgi:hypothetical protein